MNSIRRHLSYANVVATLALVFAMSGGALAASRYMINSTKQINPKVLKALRGRTGKIGPAGPQGPAGLPGAAGLQGTKGAEGGKGTEGTAGLSALSTLPSGQSESGDYGIYTPNSTTTGFLNISVTFPIPLAAGTSNIVYTTTTASHCSGPGHAERGYLCIYSGNSGRVTAPPEVGHFEEGPHLGISGRFGFDLEWKVTGAEAFDLGTYTVTAP